MTPLAGTPAAAAAAPTGLTLFSSNLLPAELHTHTAYQLMREKGASSQDNLQVIDKPAAAPAAVTRSPFLPSFHKTPSTHQLKSSWRTVEEKVEAGAEE